MKYDRYDNPGKLFTLAVVLFCLIGFSLSCMSMTDLLSLSTFKSQHLLAISIQIIALLMTARIVYVYLKNPRQKKPQ